MTFGNVTPVQRIFDEAKALAFCITWLGFEVRWRHGIAGDLPLCIAVGRAGCGIQLAGGAKMPVAGH